MPLVCFQIPSQSFPVRELLNGSMHSKQNSRLSSARGLQGGGTRDKSKQGKAEEMELVVFWQVGNSWSVIRFLQDTSFVR